MCITMSRAWIYWKKALYLICYLRYKAFFFFETQVFIPKPLRQTNCTKRQRGGPKKTRENKQPKRQKDNPRRLAIPANAFLFAPILKPNQRFPLNGRENVLVNNT